MASNRPTETHQPSEPAGDGMDPYPTYRNGRGPARSAGGTKPTDTNLPRARRTYALPIFIGIVVFGLVILIRLMWGGINVARTTDEAMTPGDPAAPAISSPTSETPAAGTDIPEADGVLDADGQAQPATGPGEVEPTPGGIDVPGGTTATPVQEAPAQ